MIFLVFSFFDAFSIAGRSAGPNCHEFSNCLGSVIDQHLVQRLEAGVLSENCFGNVYLSCFFPRTMKS